MILSKLDGLESVHLEDVEVVSDLPGCCEGRRNVEKLGDTSGLCAPMNIHTEQWSHCHKWNGLTVPLAPSILFTPS